MSDDRDTSKEASDSADPEWGGREAAGMGMGAPEGTVAERLRLAEGRFEDIARLVSDWIWETDRAFRFTFVSPRITELLGRLPREIQGIDLFTFGGFVPGGRSGVRVPDAMLRSPFKDMPYLVKTRTGEERRCLLSGVPVFSDATGAFLGFRGTARDVTNELEARADASRSQVRLVDAIESISEGFILYDVDGRLLLCNRRIREYWHELAHRLVPGTPISTLLRASARMIASPQPSAFVRHVTRQESRGEAGLELQLKDGRWLRISDRQMADGATVSIHADITAAKLREEALQVAKNTAEAANRAKSAFLANISHELRTPLNAIIGFSEIMRDRIFGPIGNPAYEDYVGSIVESAHHLLGLINDILDVAKAEAGKLELEEADLAVGSVVASAVRLLSERAQRQRLEMVVQPFEDLPTLHADERRLKQILINLLSNAIKFTEPGGKVEVRGGLDADGAFYIAVSDTGIGIASEHMAEALAPFGQVDSGLSRKFHGTGLGLPLTRAFAELHGGRLELVSEPGVGTTVTVRFPKERVRPRALVANRP